MNGWDSEYEKDKLQFATFPNIHDNNANAGGNAVTNSTNLGNISKESEYDAAKSNISEKIKSTEFNQLSIFSLNIYTQKIEFKKTYVTQKIFPTERMIFRLLTIYMYMFAVNVIMFSWRKFLKLCT